MAALGTKHLGRILLVAGLLVPTTVHADDFWKRKPASEWTVEEADRKSTRLNSSHGSISYAVFCLKKKKSESNSRDTNTRAKRIMAKSQPRNVGREGEALLK